MMRYLLPGLLVAGLFLSVIAGGCRGCQKETTEQRPDVPPQCGECLDLPTGEVCTVTGTMRNSCLAICMRQKILCNMVCPCPKK